MSAGRSSRARLPGSVLAGPMPAPLAPGTVYGYDLGVVRDPDAPTTAARPTPTPRPGPQQLFLTGGQTAGVR